MPLKTNDTPGSVPPLTFPRLMQNKYSGAVYLVTPEELTGGKPVNVYAATCIHHAARPQPAPGHGFPMPPALPEPVGTHIADAAMANLQDYPNVVYLSNDGS